MNPTLSGSNDDFKQDNKKLTLPCDYLKIKTELEKKLGISSPGNAVTVVVQTLSDVPEFGSAMSYPNRTYTFDHNLLEILIGESKPKLSESPKRSWSELSGALTRFTRPRFEESIEDSNIRESTDDLILNEEDTKLFLKEVDELEYSPETLEFFKDSKNVYEKLKKGEFTIDL